MKKKFSRLTERTLKKKKLRIMKKFFLFSLLITTPWNFKKCSKTDIFRCKLRVKSNFANVNSHIILFSFISNYECLYCWTWIYFTLFPCASNDDSEHLLVSWKRCNLIIIFVGFYSQKSFRHIKENASKLHKIFALKYSKTTEKSVAYLRSLQHLTGTAFSR